MQEESSMDRKPAKSNLGDCTSPATKLPAVRSTGIQDAGSNRGRHYRRNGPPHRGDRRRQFNYREQDRRNPGHNVEKRENREVSHAVVRYDERNLNAHESKGNRKQNLNHLLNFTIAPRHHDDYGPRRGAYHHPRRPKYNKEQFLQANCQFVVRASEDYKVHLVDPDLLVNWDLIEQIRLRSNEVPSCPICLYPPSAAKMTRCGHIYCWPCVLHYLALSDKQWRKCPICDVMINQADLKSVSVISYHEPAVGEKITFNLMRRGRNDTIAVSVKDYKEGISQTLPTLTQSNPTSVYSKLLTASYEEVLENIVKMEKSELLAKLMEESGQPEACFIQQALTLLEERCQDLYAGNYIAKKVEETLTLNKPDENNSNTSNIDVDKHSALVYESAFDEKLADPDLYQDEHQADSPECDGASPPEPSISRERNLSEGADEPQVTPEDLDISKLQKSGSCNLPKANFYFYQAADGQSIFLHALNVHMLVSEYGALEHCPLALTGRILELEGTTMDEALRNKLRYLSHLPVTTTFQVAEIELKPPTVQPTTINRFYDDLEKRRRNRTRRARSEKKREKRISQEEKKKWAAYPNPETIVRSVFHHPDPMVPDSPPSAEDNAGTGISNPDQVEALDAPKSFAQMLREGKTRPSSKKCGWNTAAPALQQVDQQREPRVRKDTTESEDDWVPPPEYHQSFSNAIALAMKNTAEPEADNKKQSEGRKKKKKGKAQLLFSTSMSRGK